MTRIELEDDTMSVIMKMADGNPGAMRVCMDLLKEAENIDTDDIMGGFGSLLMLDSEAVYGPEIWMLYKDVCKEQLWKMVGVIRACQLGIINQSQLHHAINNRGEGINIDDCIKQVADRLKGFKIPEEA